VCFHEDGSSRAQQCGGVGEHPDDVGAALDLLVEPLQRIGLVDQILLQCAREIGEGGDVVASAESLSAFTEFPRLIGLSFT
jgi:hypothetical protein